MPQVYRLLLSSIFFLAALVSASAHTGGIKGGAYDAQTHEPLIGASVSIPALNKHTVTDVFGTYHFPNLAPGKYEVRITYIGYKPVSEETEVVENETVALKSALVSSSLELAETTVTADPELALSHISAVALRLRPVNTSQDILRFVPGLFIAQHAGGGKAEQIFLRGFDVDHGTDVALSVDGMPVNMVSHAHGQGYSDLHFVIPETIEGIDFQKGPYYAATGNFGTAGLVNFNTRRSLKRSMAKVEVGRFNSYRAVAMADLLGEKAKANHQNAYLATEYFSSDGYFNSPQNLNRFNLFAKYNALLSEDKIVTVSLSTFSSRWDASGQIPVRAVEQGLISRFGAIDNTEGGQTSRSNANFQITKLLPGNAWVRNQVYLTNYNFELYSNFTFFLNDSLNGDQIRQKENRNLIGYNTVYGKEWTLAGNKAKTEIGADLRYDNVANLELSRTRNRRTTLTPLALGTVNETNASVFASQALELSPRFTLSLGARYDHFLFNYVNDLDTVFARQQVSKGIASPKLSLYYALTPTAQLYAHAGTGFHSNDTRVVVQQSGRHILPRAVGGEVGSVFKPVQQLLVNVAFWRLYLEQEFVYVGDEAIVEPSGRTDRMGVDLSLQYQFARYFYADADFNITRPRALDVSRQESYIPLAPLFTGIGGLAFRHPLGLSSSLRYRYLADRPANETNTVTAQGYYLLDAVASYTTKRFEVGIAIENLLNREWREAQFDTESRLQHEQEPVSEIHFTPGTPFSIRANISFFY